MMRQILKTIYAPHSKEGYDAVSCGSLPQSEGVVLNEKKRSDG